MKNNMLLLKTLLLSTSQVNIYKHTDDKKKKQKVRLAFFGMFCTYTMIVSYSIFAAIGLCVSGLADATPALCALIISSLAFVFTLLKTDGYLFNFKEYDMLMSLPFESSTVAACKFLYMYIKSLPWYISISVAMMAGYVFFTLSPIYVIPLWLILSLILPIIPMLVAAFLGFLIAKVSSGFKKTNLIKTVLTFVFIIFCFSLRYIIEALTRDESAVSDTLKMTADLTHSVSKYYPPVGWFSSAVTDVRISDILMLCGVTILLFAVVFRIVGRSYRQINSALASHAASKNYKMTGQKKHSVVNTIAYKEFKRMTGSTVYITNVAMGDLLALIISAVTLIMGFDGLISIVTQNAPFEHDIVRPAIPFIIYFCVGMMSSTTCSLSLEGKNWWILQSMPIEKKTIFMGKMLFNMYLTVPFMILGVLSMCISAGVPLIDTILYLILGITLCAFSTTWGMVCGAKHARFDWENEVEVIKQGAAVVTYMLPNMFVVMGLIVGVIFLGMNMNHSLLALIFIVIAAALTGLCYARVISLSRRTL